MKRLLALLLALLLLVALVYWWRQRRPATAAAPAAAGITPTSLMVPVVDEPVELFESVLKQGFLRAYVDGDLIEVAEPPKLNRRQNHSISVVVDRLVPALRPTGSSRARIAPAGPGRWGRPGIAHRRRGRDDPAGRALMAG